MQPGVVVHTDMTGFQRQYGTLWQAVEVYLDGNMQRDQAASLERVVDAQFIGAVAITRAVKAAMNMG